MKKAVAFILLLISLTAVFTPCCGSDDCNEITMAANEQHENEQEENCSPFVTCGYCSGFTQLTIVQEIPVVPPVMIAHYSKDTDWLSSAYTDQLLQPPKPV
ncbi:MAG TPA: hypothetical protein DHW64_02180 [Chitinophagaceae bacterium]|nr:hypothetical protein [Chitinophagaceae bacterium]